MSIHNIFFSGERSKISNIFGLKMRHLDLCPDRLYVCTGIFGLSFPEYIHVITIFTLSIQTPS